MLEILSREIDVRPAGAPTLDVLRARVRKVTLGPSALLLDFEASDLGLVEAFVAAERACCASIGWDIETEDGLRLRVSAPSEALAVLAEIWR